MTCSQSHRPILTETIILSIKGWQTSRQPVNDYVTWTWWAMCLSCLGGLYTPKHSFHSLFHLIVFLINFLMWTTFLKVSIEFVTVLFLLYSLVFWPRGMWDLSYLTRDWTHTPGTGKWSFNHWTTREVFAFDLNQGTVVGRAGRIFPSNM